MSQLEKLLQRVKRNPKSVRFGELDRILIRAGFARSQPGSGSSHHVYRRGVCKLVVPYRQPYVLQAYVLRAIKLLEDTERNE